MKNLVENAQIVEAVHPQGGGSAITGDYISMKKVGHVTVLCNINQTTADTIAITIEQATAVAGTGSTAITKAVPIFLVADAATTDVWVAQTAAVSYTTTAATKAKMVAFEIDAEDLDAGYDCLTVKFGASDSANIVAAQYICGMLRYGPSSVIAD